MDGTGLKPERRYVAVRRGRGTVGEDDVEVDAEALETLRRKEADARRACGAVMSQEGTREELDALGLAEVTVGCSFAQPEGPAESIARERGGSVADVGDPEAWAAPAPIAPRSERAWSTLGRACHDGRWFVARERGAGVADVGDPEAWAAPAPIAPRTGRARSTLGRACHDARWAVVHPAEPGRAMHVHHERGLPGLRCADDEVWTGTAASRSAVTAFLDDIGLGIGPDAGVAGVVAGPVDLAPLSAPGPLELFARAEAWRAGLYGEGLVTLARERLAVGDEWAQLVAAGQVVRQGARDEGASGEAVAAQVSARSSDARASQAASARLRVAVSDRQEAHASGATSAARHEAVRHQSLVAVSYARADLARLALLLESGDGGDAVAPALAALDELGETWTRALPSVLEIVDDERLLRALVASPMGWSTESVRW